MAMRRAFGGLDAHADRLVVSPEAHSIEWRTATRSVELKFDVYEFEASLELVVDSPEGRVSATFGELERVRTASGRIPGMQGATPERLEAALTLVWEVARESLVEFLDGDLTEIGGAVETRAVRRRAFTADQHLRDAEAAAREQRWSVAATRFEEFRREFPDVPLTPSQARKESLAQAHVARAQRERG